MVRQWIQFFSSWRPKVIYLQFQNRGKVTEIIDTSPHYFLYCHGLLQISECLKSKWYFIQMKTMPFEGVNFFSLWTINVSSSMKQNCHNTVELLLHQFWLIYVWIIVDVATLNRYEFQTKQLFRAFKAFRFTV